MRRTIYKFLFSLIFLMGVTSAWADDLTLFTTNFSTADGWTTESIITSSTTEATRTIKGTKINFKGYKNSDLTVAVGQTDSADGTLIFTGNNISASAGDASNANYYMAIPVSGVNGEVTVTTTGDATKWYYSYDDGNVGTIIARAQASDNGGFTITGLKKSDVTIYIGSSGKKLNSITITTPKAIKSQTVTGVKIGGTKVEGASFDATNTYVSAQGAPAAPKASIIKHIVYADDSEEDVDVDVTLAKNGEFFVGSATINKVVYTIKVPVTASNACQLTSILFSNSVYGAIAEPIAESGTPGEEGYVAAANGKVTVCYMAGTDAPTITTSSIKVSEAAQYNVNENTITVTAEDGTSTKLYEITYTAITPLAVNSDIEKTTFTEVPSWVSNPYNWDATKGVKFAKAVDEANNMRIAKGFTRQYYFVGPAKSLTLTSMDAARAINVYVNGTKVNGITTTAKKGDITITLSETENNMVCIESNQTGGDGGFTDYAVVAAEKTPEPEPTFTNVAVDLSQAGVLSSEEATVSGTNLTFGVTMVEGAATRVEATAENANIVISGKTHGDAHGLTNAVVTVPVPAGAYKVSVGTCAWGGTAKVKANGVVLTSFSTNNGTCYHQNKTANVAVGYAIVKEATSLEISDAGYLPYIAVEAIDPAEIPTDRTISFKSEGADGTIPANVVVEDGAEFVVPANHTLYKEGYTLTAWTDGTENYAFGTTIKVVKDMELTAVYAKNNADINNRDEVVTVKWDFQRKNGAPTLNIGSNKAGIYVAQATIGDETIDVKMEYNTKGGKLANAAWTDWAQLNGGFEFYLPSAKDAVVSMETYSVSTATTVDGVALEGNDSRTPSITVASDNNPITVVYGADASYFRWIQIVLPKTEAVGPTPAEWESYELVLNKEGLLTADEIANKNETTFGIALDEEGKAIRVAADATDAIAVITGKYHSDHGMNPFSMTAKVPGAVKITAGTCSYGTCTVTVNGTAAGETVVGDNVNKTTCWKNNKDNVATGIYNGEAGEITITTGCYTPYIKIEKFDAGIHNVTFAKGDIECEGTQLPEAKEVAAGEKITIPANYTLYKEGYTLTGWTDGTNTYNVGTSFAPTAETTLTPVFTQNTKNLADRTEPVTVKWNFRRDQGAPVVAYEGKDGIYVAQASVDNETIDVKMDFSAANGKFNNAGNTDWAQVNNGTTFTIPSCKGATVSLETYDAITATTIDGVAAEGNTNKTYSTEIGSKAETIVIAVADGRYYRYIQVVLPVVETPAPTKKEKVIYSTEFSDWASAAVADSYTTDVTTTDKQDITFTLHQTKVDPTSFDESRFKEPSTKGYLIAEKNKQGTITTTAFNNITTLTFVHGATGGSRGWGLKVKGDGDSDWVTVSDAFASPSQGQKVEIEINRNNVQLQFYNLADDQNAYLMSLEIKGMVEVTGESYTVGIAAEPAEGGAVTIYPKADDYTEGDEISLTATENFGYDFVNWTNAAGEEVSKDAKFKTTVSANETYTANFVQVDTYAINVAVEGGANDYMVTFNPAPTVVENKNMYEAGTKVAITAAENPILTFNNWSNGETSKEIEVTMNEDIDLTATYSAVDFIVGWDFYKAGNNGRNADFFAADNDAVSLVLRDEAGKTYGWLDKSQVAAGGYEGRPGAVNWKNDAAIGTYYWQTKVNAEAFTDLKVKTAMVYNYNAYQKYDVQASLNGTDWETIGSINMTGAKAWTDLEASFPGTYNNQKEVYVRWIADKTSKVDGTSSNNDGACLGATYITGTAKLVDDGVAPVLVSTVPAEGADNASANGKIVLTFDEKVKVAEGAKATLGDNQLTPSVSGKTVTFEYKGLNYATAYSFSLPANSVADLTDNYLTEAITINFETKAKPTIEKGLYDVIVTNGEEMKAAIAQANSRADKTKRFRIFVMPGSHKIPVYDTKVTVEVELANGTKEQRTYDEPRTYITSDNISIIGADYETTTITNTTPTETFTGRFGEANVSEGIGNNDVFQIQAKNTYFQGVTVKTGIGDARGRDIAIQDKGDKTIFKEARLWGYQDTYTNNNSNGRFYFEGGVVRGRTDYLCGKGDIWFEGVTLQQCGQGGYPIVPSLPKKYGWIFNGCTLTPETSDVTCTLGRPWGSGTPIALLINTTMEVVPGAEGWSEMSGGWPKRFAEYNSVTKNGTVIDLSNRKTTFGGKENCNNPVLTAEEAAEYSIAKVMGDGDDWDPTAYTEQASAPTNVSLKGEALTWDDSNYVFCWAVIKNGNIVEFTTTPSYTVDDKTATWSVRAANEMGGLGEATIADTTSGINEAVSTQSRSAKYVTPMGIVIVKDGKKYTVTGAQMK